MFGFANKIAFDRTFDEPGRGFHLGINRYKHNAEGISPDLQLSMNLISETEGSGDHFTVQALYGARYYFKTHSEGHKRIFVSALLGPAFRNESGDDFIDNRLDIGYSAGAYLELSKVVLGLSMDAPASLVFKIGLTF